MENLNLDQCKQFTEIDENHASSIIPDDSIKNGDMQEEQPKIVPLHVSCSQRPDWSCGPCKAYGVKKPWELI